MQKREVTMLGAAGTAAVVAVVAALANPALGAALGTSAAVVSVILMLMDRR